MKASPSDRHASHKSGKAEIRRRAILVLGMHRSGTSALTRCLNLLGTELGESLMPPVERNNPTGFWELAEAVEIHDALLSALDSSWADARPLPEGWMASQAAQVAQKRIEGLISSELASSALWAIKDPRMCLFVPLWRETLARHGIGASAILMVRHPAEVAASLKTRDMLSSNASNLIWFKHLAGAEHATRGLPRSMVTYGNLLSDWRGVFARVAGDLQLTWPVPTERAGAAIDAFLDKGQRHHRASREAGTAPEVSARMFEYCADLAAGEGGWEPVSRLVDDYLRVAEPLLAEMSSAISLSSGFAGRDRAELYFRSQDDVFSVDRVCSQVHEWAADPATLRFQLPRDSGAALLRFDPSLQAGAFHVTAVRVNQQAVTNLRERVRGVKNHAFGQLGGAGVGFMSFEDDPHIEFDMREVLSTAGDLVTIEVDCRKLDAAAVTGAEMVQQFSDLRAEMGRKVDVLQASAVRLESEIATSVEREKRLSAQVDDLYARNTALNDELAARTERENGALREAFWLSAQLAQVHEQLDAANARNADLEARHADLEAQYAESQSRIAQLESELVERRECETRALGEAFWLSAKSVRAREQLDSMQERLTELEKLHAELEASHHELEASHSELERRDVTLAEQLRNHRAFNSALQAELAEIKGSTLWRVLVRVRNMLLKIPRGSRLLLRRGMKVTWWALTPWRIPARFRFLRARRRARQGPG